MAIMQDNASHCLSVVFYTDNSVAQNILDATLKSIFAQLDEYDEFICVSWKPMDFDNYKVKCSIQNPIYWIPDRRGQKHLYLQMQMGIERSSNDVIVLAEHDVLYCQDYFRNAEKQVRAGKQDQLHYNTCVQRLSHLGFTKVQPEGAIVLSQLSAFKDTLLWCLQNRLKIGKNYQRCEFSERDIVRWHSIYDNIDIRHTSNYTGGSNADYRNDLQFHAGTIRRSLPYWNRATDLVKQFAPNIPETGITKWLHELDKSVDIRNKEVEQYKKLTYGTTYFEEKDKLTKQLDNWSSWSPDLLKQIEFIIVDDGSKVAPAVDIINKYSQILNIRCYTRPENKGWTIGESRNQVIDNCKTERILLLDLDHFVSEIGMQKVLDSCLNSTSIVYTFKCKNAEYEYIVSGPNSFCARLEDLKYVGCYCDFYNYKYGFEDIDLLYRLDLICDFVELDIVFQDMNLKCVTGLDRAKTASENKKILYKILQDRWNNMILPQLTRKSNEESDNK